MQFRYVIFNDNSKPVAIVYFQILELNPKNIYRTAKQFMQNKKSSIMNSVHSRLAEVMSLKVLVCGNALLSGEHGYALSGITREQALHAIAEAAYMIRKSFKKEISVTLIKDFYDKNNHPLSILSQFGYYSFDAGPNMAVPIRENWTAFDKYIGEMKPKYRQRNASVIKKGMNTIRHTFTLDEIERYKNELYTLYIEVADKAKFKLFFLSPDYLVELKKRLGNRFVCEAYFEGNRLIGYTTRVFNGRTMEGYFHGLNYEYNKQFELYQNFCLMM